MGTAKRSSPEEQKGALVVVEGGEHREMGGRGGSGQTRRPTMESGTGVERRKSRSIESAQRKSRCVVKGTDD